jgi:hypothetical protein
MDELDIEISLIKKDIEYNNLLISQEKENIIMSEEVLNNSLMLGETHLVCNYGLVIAYNFMKYRDFDEEEIISNISTVCKQLNKSGNFNIIKELLVYEHIQLNLSDKYGRTGYLINIGDYYLFQPSELNDNKISLLDRVIPIPYKHPNFKFDVNSDPVNMESIIAKLDKVLGATKEFDVLLYKKLG